MGHRARRTGVPDGVRGLSAGRRSSKTPLFRAVDQPVSANRIPLTVIGGFLGSGKTTLINRLLAGGHGRKLTVLVNDFGRINVDARLVRARGADTVELANGCACCAIGDSLLGTLLDVLERPEPPQHLLIEASGVADPGKIAQIGRAADDLRLDGVVVVADAVRIAALLADPRVDRTVRLQLAAADLVVVNKVDCVDPTRLGAARRAATAHAPGARVVEAVQAQLPWQLLLGGEAATGGMPRRAQAPAEPTRGAPADPGAAPSPDPPATLRVGPDHDAFATLRVELPAPVSQQALRSLPAFLPEFVVRGKGIIRLAEEADADGAEGPVDEAEGAAGKPRAARESWAVVHIVGTRVDVVPLPPLASAPAGLELIGPSAGWSETAIDAAMGAWRAST